MRVHERCHNEAERWQFFADGHGGGVGEEGVGQYRFSWGAVTARYSVCHKSAIRFKDSHISGCEETGARTSHVRVKGWESSSLGSGTRGTHFAPEIEGGLRHRSEGDSSKERYHAR